MVIYTIEFLLLFLLLLLFIHDTTSAIIHYKSFLNASSNHPMIYYGSTNHVSDDNCNGNEK